MRLLPVLPLMLLMFTTACTTPSIQQAYQNRTVSTVVVQPARAFSEASQGPYQAVLRLDPRALEPVMVDAANGWLSGSTDRGEGKPGDMGIGRRLERLSIQIQQVSMEVGQDQRLHVVVGLTGTLPAGARSLTLGATVAATALVEALEAEQKPALAITLAQVDDIRLSLPMELPGPLALFQRASEELMRDKLTRMLRANEQQRRIFPVQLPEGMLDGVMLEGLAVALVPGSPGELRLGLNTTLLAPGKRQLTTARATLATGWALELDEGLVDGLGRRMFQKPGMKTHFERSGKLSETGPGVVELEGIRVKASGLQLTTRVWYLKRPAFWQVLQLHGRPVLKNGRLEFLVDQVEHGDGAGSKVARRLVREKVQSMTSLKGPNQRMDGPLGSINGRGMQLVTEGMLCEDGFLQVIGQLRNQQAPTAASR